MKKLLSPMYSFIPNLVEYLSTEEDEREIDSMQARKCCDFKRMMLESVREGGGVGIPVPIGYDDVQDIESWPLLQSFALDHVFSPTGFFTARYTVADITEHLEVCFSPYAYQKNHNVLCYRVHRYCSAPWTAIMWITQWRSCIRPCIHTCYRQSACWTHPRLISAPA